MTQPYGQRGNWRPPKREPGPNGLWPCRYCGKECKHRVMRWCSQECHSEAWLRMSWSAMRHHILKRDGEHCALCHSAHPGFYDGHPRREWGGRTLMYVEGRHVEVTPLKLWRWEVDHIVPVKDGGTDDPANLRVLCHECHIAAGVERRSAKKAASHGKQETLELSA